MSTDPRQPRSLTILGGGVAGLAVGRYARKRGLPFTIIEGSEALGGLCRTVRWGSFRFDLGAHRFHDKDREITGDVLAMLGERIARVAVPSHIWHRGRLVAFPPRLTNLVRTVGIRTVARSVLAMTAARLRPGSSRRTFEEVTLRSYGRTLADLFLLSYSRKLWGVPCAQLSPRVGGGRLKGLSLRSVLLESLWRGRKAAHVDGSFYYPRHGIGEIADALERECGSGAVRAGVRVGRIRHARGRIVAIDTVVGERIEVDHLVSTIPLSSLTTLLDPALPPGLLRDAQRMRFRSLRLVVLLLDRASVTTSATVYFPDLTVPFTRVFEPRNRSADLAPAGRTSLVVEIPCFETDEVWAEPEEAVVARTIDALVERRWFARSEVMDARALHVPHAYPVLDLESEIIASGLRQHLRGQIANLSLAGRSGRFEYVWIHDLIREGRDLVAELADGYRVARE